MKVKLTSEQLDNIINNYDKNLEGGYADNFNIDDLAEKFDVDRNQIIEQLNKGIKVEMEHTNDIILSAEIAMDHIAEIPDYYDRLEKMEDEAENSEELTNEYMLKTGHYRG